MRRLERADRYACVRRMISRVSIIQAAPAEALKTPAPKEAEGGAKMVEVYMLKGTFKCWLG